MDVIGTEEGVAQAGFFELLQESVRDQGTGAQIYTWSWLGFHLFQYLFFQLEEHICAPLSMPQGDDLLGRLGRRH